MRLEIRTDLAKDFSLKEGKVTRAVSFLGRFAARRSKGDMASSLLLLLPTKRPCRRDQLAIVELLLENNVHHHSA